MTRNYASKRYRDVFFAANGFGPYMCFFCEEEVIFKEVEIHHEDENKENSEVSNLKASHRRCHTLHHLAQRDFNRGTLTEEGRSRMIKQRTGRKLSPESVEKMISSRKKTYDTDPNYRTQLSERSKEMWEKRTPEEKTALGQKIWETRRARGTDTWKKER